MAYKKIPYHLEQWLRGDGKKFQLLVNSNKHWRITSYVDDKLVTIKDLEKDKDNLEALKQENWDKKFIYDGEDLVLI